MSLMIFCYFALKFIKRQPSEPQSYADDISSNQNSNECYDGNNGTYSEIQHLYQIQPIPTISHIISSTKQSLTDLCYSMIPSKWSHIQHTNNQQSPDNKNMDLPV
ncbi:unnamed protein product [Rotaria sp. Silwood2]|nr:unnamed protein product [Rotaria sp. Silwood2]CAF2527292.1 unnamed protein product [Rotaria sp. Silwood2]CAF2936859.1 unnamed protein product [Rotaria sp. Silwood2]CAF3870783.1 unnamed protein product [Rotaria sp. Silwood2]CAF3916358.1 unnamed protein product [Rotaria sp. Silwood2]